jgi:outer membrane protein
MKTSTKLLVGAALAAGALTAIPAQADEGPFMVRLRAIYISTANKSDANASQDLPADYIHVQSKWAPDIDLEYFFANNWSSELLLTIPQKHDVSVVGVGTIGSFKELPPTLTVKYNFLPDGVFRPYVGLGVNVTFISDVNLGGAKLDSTSFGGAAQAGFDIKFAEHWFASVDAKYVQIKSDVKLPDGTKLTTVKVDPWLLGAGIGYRF